jgi:hypothetical protein
MPDTQPNKDVLPAASISSDLSLASAVAAAPTAEPPALAQAGGDAGAIAATVWVTGKKINALWVINENRNSWVAVAGIGWVKLANNSDTVIVALTMLGANARHTQGIVNYRQESDNMIHEMYVW